MFYALKVPHLQTFDATGCVVIYHFNSDIKNKTDAENLNVYDH